MLPEVILQEDVMTKKFKSFIEQGDALVSILNNAKVENDESLKIVEDNVKKLKDVKNLIEKTRKEIGAPLLEATKKINGHVKPANDKFSLALATITKSITRYKEVQLAMERAEAAKEAEKLRATMLDEKDHVERISFLLEMSFLSIFGGEIEIKKKNKIKELARLQTLEAAKALANTIETKFPKPETFVGQEKFALEARTFVFDLIETIQVKAISPESVIDDILDSLYPQSLGRKNMIIESFTKSLVKKEVKETKKVALKGSYKGSGIKRVISFEVEDITKVPHQYLQVNELLLNQFKVANREDILKQIEDDKESVIIKGIRFSVSTKAMV